MRYGTGMAMVLVAGLLWSFQALMIRQIEEAGPWAVLSWRSLAMVPVLLLFSGLAHGRFTLSAIRRAGWPGSGRNRAGRGHGRRDPRLPDDDHRQCGFLLAASPFLAAILGWLILREAVAPPTWGAIALALVGIFIMVRDGLAGGALVGNVAALVSALGFAAFSVALRWRRIEDSLPASILGAGFAVVAGALASVHFGQLWPFRPGSDLVRDHGHCHHVGRDDPLHIRQPGVAFGRTDASVQHRGAACPLLGLADHGRDGDHRHLHRRRGGAGGDLVQRPCGRAPDGHA